MRVRLRDFLGLSWRSAATILVVGGILHILATLLISKVGATPPHARFSAVLPANKTTILAPPTAQTQVIPFQAPEALQAICPFDASKGPVIVRAALPGAGWVFGLHSPDGANFYSVVGQDSRRTDIGLIMIAGGETFVPLPRDLAAPQTMLRLQLPSPTGLMVVTAPLHGESYRQQAEAELRAASCETRTR